MRSAVRSLLCAVILGLSCVACSDGPSDAARSATPFVTPLNTPGQGQPTQGSSAAISYRDVSQELDRDDGVLQFVTPTKNIGCAILATGGTCHVLDHTWTAPPNLRACVGDSEDSPDDIWFSERAGVGGCGGTDTVYDAQAMVLEYGTGLKARHVRCSSAKSGLTCENTRTRHGFSVSRTHYRLF